MRLWAADPIFEQELEAFMHEGTMGFDKIDRLYGSVVY